MNQRDLFTIKIDRRFRQDLKVIAAKKDLTIKQLLEDMIMDYFEKNKSAMDGRNN
jgi:predicted DNA-binding ribbon-helix-helix protein